MNEAQPGRGCIAAAEEESTRSSPSVGVWCVLSLVRDLRKDNKRPKRKNKTNAEPLWDTPACPASHSGSGRTRAAAYLSFVGPVHDSASANHEEKSIWSPRLSESLRSELEDGRKFSFGRTRRTSVSTGR